MPFENSNPDFSDDLINNCTPDVQHDNQRASETRFDANFKKISSSKLRLTLQRLEKMTLTW